MDMENKNLVQAEELLSMVLNNNGFDANDKIMSAIGVLMVKMIKVLYEIDSDLFDINETLKNK